MSINIDKLVSEFGGCVWEREGKKRVYFNDIEEISGLSINRYGTGNVSSASLNGKKISNSHARRIAPDSFSKLWYDCVTEKFESRNLNNEVFESAVSRLTD